MCRRTDRPPEYAGNVRAMGTAQGGLEPRTGLSRDLQDLSIVLTVEALAARSAVRAQIGPNSPKSPLHVRTCTRLGTTAVDRHPPFP